MSIAGATTGRPRPMSAVEAMTGGPWLFAAIALFGLGFGALQAVLGRLLTAAYSAAAGAAILALGLTGLGLGAALAHGLARRVPPAVLPVAGALLAAGGVGLVTALAPLLGATVAPAPAALLAAVPSIGAGLALAAAAVAADRRVGRLLGLWLTGGALGAPAGAGLLALAGPLAALAATAGLLAAAGLAAARAGRCYERLAAGVQISTLALALSIALGTRAEGGDPTRPTEPALAVALFAPGPLTPTWLALLLTGMLLLSLLGYLAWTVAPEHFAVWRAVPFAVAAGAGLPLLQLALAARLVVWLDGPTPAALIAGLALGSWAALGAAVTDRLPLAHLPQTGRMAALLLTAWCGLELAGLLLPADRLALLPPAGRLVLAAALLAAPGIVVGMPLPLLLRAAARRYAERPVALLLAIHGAALALGSAGAVAVAVTLGLNAALLLAAGLAGLLALLARPVLGR